jgi:ADP-ribosyl-[dinitrogen reductase] hydrolase
MKQAFSYEDWAMGMMFGMAIGDAMGAPIEFQPSREPESYVRHYMTGGAHNVSKGEFTDDTSMALAMADAFIEANDFNPALIMDNFLKWKNEGAYSPRGVMFDCGNTVHAALRAYERDNTDPFTSSTDPMSAGNGGLMRLAPAIIAGRYRDEAVHFAKETTRLTHGADEALKYSAALAAELWQQEALDEYADLKHSTDIDRHQVMSGGYVKETYQAAWWAFQTTDCFEDCIIKAINRGHDSDTTGAVAGMIAGAIYGYSAIPDWMVDGLQWKQEVEQHTRSLMRVGRRRTPRSEINRIQSQLPNANASAGDIVVVDGHKCICICPWASYGGGSLSLWAIEGHSAQLTSRNPEVQQGYICGTCIKIDKQEMEIHFETSALHQNNTRSEVLKLGLKEIGRYDTNWYE